MNDDTLDLIIALLRHLFKQGITPQDILDKLEG